MFKKFIDPTKSTVKELKEMLKSMDAVKFISLSGVDLGNHSTDEKIPKSYVLDDFDTFLKDGIQTDGSSVFLPIIAELNNAKVDIIPDTKVKWFIDYNCNNNDELVGTLDIPSFLKHENKYVGSRSILKNTSDYIKKETINLLKKPNALESLPIESVDEIEDVVLTSATELEFWVNTPNHETNIEKLNASQELKEHYWKRTVGQVRTALENSLIKLDESGFITEMAHKEVGGVKSKLNGTNEHTGIMEQLEIDWEYDFALQSSDNEMYAKNIIKDTFESEGLEVTFKAKPIDEVAGSGEHTHVSLSLKLKNGDYVNIFSHKNHKKNYMSSFGWGALYGLIKNYDIVNPFVTSTNNAFKRLTPGFEAPVSTVASIGKAPEIPSRNRTVLTGLIRDLNNPLATRFELRSPNPETNTYLATSAIYLAMLDGIKYAINNKKTSKELHDNFIKKENTEKFYLKNDRLYCSELDVFDDYTETERNNLFGKPPSTVYENLINLSNSPNSDILYQGDILSDTLINSYKESMLEKWTKELEFRLRENVLTTVRACKKLHENETLTDLDVVNWEKVNSLRHELAKDSMGEKSLLTNLLEKIKSNELAKASDLQIEINKKVKLLNKLYNNYKKNLINL
ncbi:MAG: glutamine synthetase [Bacillota bacterium]